MAKEHWREPSVDPDRRYEYTLYMLDRVANDHPFNEAERQDFTRRSAVIDRSGLAIDGSNGYTADGRVLFDWRRLGAEACDDAVEYFFGRWRNPYRVPWGKMDEAACRRELEWYVPYRHGLMWGLCLDRHECVARLLAWPDDDLDHDDVFECTPQDRDVHVMLAKWARGEASTPAAVTGHPLARSVLAGRNRRPKIILNAVSTLAAGSQAGVTESVAELVKDFRRRRYDPRNPLKVIDIDATILWHLARTRGVPVGGVDERVTDYIVCPNLPVGAAQ